MMTLSSQFLLKAKAKCENRKVDQCHFIPTLGKGRIDRETFAVVYLQSAAAEEEKDRLIITTMNVFCSFIGVPKKKKRLECNAEN